MAKNSDASSPVQLVSMWIKRGYFAMRNRVEILWTKSRRLDFDHSIAALIHPLTTFRQIKFYRNNLTKKSTITKLYMVGFSSKNPPNNRMENCLIFTCFLSNDWDSPHFGFHVNW